MLQDSDLSSFLNAFDAASHSEIEAVPPSLVLAKADGIFRSEVWRLVLSLQIASVLGDAPQLAATAAQIILDGMDGDRCVSPSNESAWAQAISWALTQPALAEPNNLTVPVGRDRERVVGEACARLRKRGYRIKIGAYGPKIAEESRNDLVQSAESLVRLIGGIETASQVFRYLRDANLYHDGLWLFGELGLNIYDAKLPMPPVGWLVSLALRNIDCSKNARKPHVAWKTLIELTTDFAAAHDCQRYSQFDSIDLHPSQIHSVFSNSTLWRELFTLPQTPAFALSKILDALAEILTHEDEELIGFSFNTLSKEILRLVKSAANDRPTIHPRTGIERDLPLLWRLTGGAASKVNSQYMDPRFARERTQDGTLIFACGRDRAVVLPRSILATAACEFVFELIWSKLGPRAAEIVGKTLENAIAIACKRKAATVLVRHQYQAESKCFEIDVATRDENRIVMLETKGKTLTRKSRSGDMLAFFIDYSESFLRMLSQLIRHEINIRKGFHPFTQNEQDTESLRPVKVAVSPLSYGAVSDQALISSIIRSLVGAKLTPTTHEQAHRRAVETLNKRVENILTDIALVAPNTDGYIDLFPYLIDVFWLDFGQVLYLIDRANTIWDAFSPLKHITFSSHDFWTELALADRGGFTAGKWRSATG